eukprot:gene8788-33657_t
MQNQPALEKDRYKNQPALEKDRYKVRKAFKANTDANKTLVVADYGQLELRILAHIAVRKAFKADTDANKTLVVADYGQLELRILAHIAACKSMLEAFTLGGDFHSRTAYGMYDYIKDAVRDVRRTAHRSSQKTLSPQSLHPVRLDIAAY